MKREKMRISPKRKRESLGSNWLPFLAILPKRQVILSLIYGSARILLTALWPLLLYRMLKDMGTSSSMQILGNLVLVMLLLGLIAWFTHLQSKRTISILKGFTLELIDRLWKKMNALDWFTFHGHNRVYYFDLLMVEAWRVRAGIAAIVESLIVNSLIAGMLSVLILFINLPLFLVCFGGMLLMGTCQYVSSKRTRPFVKQFHAAWRDQHHWVATCVDQVDLIKMDRGYLSSAAANLKNTGLFLVANSELLTKQAYWRNINQLVSQLVRIGVFLIGIYWVLVGVVSLEDLLLILLIVSMVQGHMMQIPAALNQFIEAHESLITLTDFFKLKDEQNSVASPEREFAPIRSLSVRDLSHHYGDKLAVGPLSLNLEVGKIYLWKGANGSGKSTAAHILLGLLRPMAGSLWVNGEEMEWGELQFLRNRFAFLNQDSTLFMGSLKENILFGHPEPVKAMSGLQASWLWDLLPVSPQGENRWVGERGEGLSGGEAKRVALIREFLRSSQMIILDEPLNHLDDYAISELKREIVAIKPSSIIIIISHQKGFEPIADEIKEF